MPAIFAPANQAAKGLGEAGADDAIIMGLPAAGVRGAASAVED